MFLTESKQQILLALYHGPLNPHEIEEVTGLAPFELRAELKDLRRDRLVLEYLDTKRHVWELTGRGYGEVYRIHQLDIRGITAP